MNEILHLILATLCCFRISQSQVYYFTPSRGQCDVNGTALSPCYMLRQLALSNVHSASVELVLLPGTHVIPKNHNIQLSDLKKVYIYPMAKSQSAAVKCHSNLNFYDIAELNITSLQFTSCTLSLYGLRSVFIANTVIQLSVDKFALDSYQRTNITVSSCKFLSNNGAIGINSHYTSRYLSIDQYVQLNDTLIESSGRPPDHGEYRTSAVFVENAMLSLRNCHFIDNAYGAIDASGSFLVLKNSSFVNNSFQIDQFAYNYHESVTLKIGKLSANNCYFLDSSVLITYEGSYPFINQDDKLALEPISFNNCLFQGNNSLNVDKKSALRIQNINITVLNTQFTNNFGDLGGAMNIQGNYFRKNRLVCEILNCTFTANKAKRDGGAIYCENFAGRIEIQGGHSLANSAEGSGGFAYLSNCDQLSFRGQSHNVSQSTASMGGAIFASYSNISFEVQSVLSENMAQQGGAIYASRASNVSIKQATTLTRNIATRSGGALYLVHSTLQLESSLTLSYNEAGGEGGAIYVLDNACRDYSQCFFYLSKHKAKNVLNFLNNSATDGSLVYGGLLDRCFHRTTVGINFLKAISSYDPTPLGISSDPVKVCICTDDHQINCSARESKVHRMRGEVISVFAAVVDQDQNPKNGIIEAYYNDSAELGRSEKWKIVSNKCSKLSYHVFTAKTSTSLILQPEGYCKLSMFSSITIHVTILPCGRGLERNVDSCECEQRIKQFTTICNIGADSVQRKGSLWLKYDRDYLQVNTNCPPNYCNFTSDTISLAYPDQQCANHRSGVMCGACQDTYSIALGGSKCLHCPSSYTLAWLIPVFAVAGLALVALLLILNMTISHGTLNGLIFYANVISISELTNHQNCSIHPVLSVFIAWINLDLGVETCFYSGMDTYQKTWLQFAFPLYIWLVIGSIILVSHYSTIAMKVFGRNNVAILATLFILSYSKILKTIIVALNSTIVLRGSAVNKTDMLVPYKVWAYDGNIQYLSGQHIPLFAAALGMLVLFFLPYTLLLTFGQCLRSLPVRRRCVLKIIRSTAFISIMDAYHAPYSKRHRYWTGLMLLTRCILSITLAFNYLGDKLISIMHVTTLLLIGIFVLKMTCAVKIYKKFFIDIMEICFLTNLMILSYGLKNASTRASGPCTYTNVSISISLAMFVGILAYHTSLQIYKTTLVSKIKSAVLVKWQKTKTSSTKAKTSPITQASHTTVELRESLLTSN